jgi:hypothetical protein
VREASSHLASSLQTSLSLPHLLSTPVMSIHRAPPTATTVAARISAAAPAAAAALALALNPIAAGAFLLDFEGIGNNAKVGNYYAGGGGGPAEDYGATFGTRAVAAVDRDAPGGVGTYSIANEPSPHTVLYMDGVASQAFLTVVGGFTDLSFQYASDAALTATVYDGPDLTGSVLGSKSLTPSGRCPGTSCGDPNGQYGIWLNVTVPFSGVAKSVGFSTSSADFILIDDMIVGLAPATNPPTRPPTRAPTKSPTQSPTQAPTKAPTNPPTRPPTESPTKSPTQPPTKAPTKASTQSPTKSPTKSPTLPPTGKPSTTTTRKSPTKAPAIKAPANSPTRRACRRRWVKGAMMRCGMMMMTKPKVV